MKTIGTTRELFGEKITTAAILLDGGIQVSVFGGSRPHIGAVSITDPAGNCHTTQFPGHKDGVVSERWAETLFNAGLSPVVVEAGIHYDALGREEIAAVVALTDEMLKEVLEVLS